MESSGILVLDHGYVRLDGVFGTDADIVRIARVSTGKGNKTPEEDQRFLDYLWRHAHLSPFEMPVLRFEVKMPIFVARQWVRHRTHSMNEYSARYSEMQDDYYLPETDRFLHEPTDNRQASGGVVTRNEAANLQDRLDQTLYSSRYNYDVLLERGAQREVARLALPMSGYTLFYWQQNLRNLLHLLHLRLDTHAQWETRQYAEAVAVFVQEHFPWTWDAFDRHTLRGRHFDADELAVIRSAVNADVVTEALRNSPMRETRRKEFLGKLTEEEVS